MQLRLTVDILWPLKSRHSSWDKLEKLYTSVSVGQFGQFRYLKKKVCCRCKCKIYKVLILLLLMNNDTCLCQVFPGLEHFRADEKANHGDHGYHRGRQCLGSWGCYGTTRPGDLQRRGLQEILRPAASTQCIMHTTTGLSKHYHG